MISVDASVAAKWLFIEEHSDRALALVATTSHAGQRIVAPPLLRFEVANLIRQRMRIAGLSLTEALDRLDHFRSFPIAFSAPTALSRRALTLADRFNLAAAYDAHYLALAELRRCLLWSDDQRLLRLVGGRFPFLRWIGDYRR